MQDNNNNNHYSNKYDPNAVISAANASPDLDGGRFIFQSALLEWVDDAREGGRAGDEGVREAVATLWLALAQYLMQSKQYKSATETLDEAVQCPVVRDEPARLQRHRQVDEDLIVGVAAPQRPVSRGFGFRVRA